MDLDTPDRALSRKRSNSELIQAENGSSFGKRCRPSRDEISTVRASIEQFRRVFPSDRFNYLFPPCIFLHQLYSTLPTRSQTEINREVDNLRQCHEICCFKMHSPADELIIVKSEDFREHVRGYARDHMKNPVMIEKFLDHIESIDLSVTTADLKKDRIFTDDDVQALVNIGVLVFRDVGNWWLSFPGAGQFMKAFVNGREKILMMVKKAKYSSVLESELIHRGLPKRCIGVHYAIHDIIGKDLVETTNTTSGRLLRYR